MMKDMVAMGTPLTVLTLWALWPTVVMDIHVGFIKYKKNTITFLHSSYYDPPLKVIDQDIMKKSLLTDSKYRVLGKIFDDNMIVKWLTGERYPITYNYFNQ